MRTYCCSICNEEYHGQNAKENADKCFDTHSKEKTLFVCKYCNKSRVGFCPECKEKEKTFVEEIERAYKKGYENATKNFKESLKKLKEEDSKQKRELIIWIQNWKKSKGTKDQLIDSVNRFINNENKDKLAGEELTNG